MGASIAGSTTSDGDEGNDNSLDFVVPYRMVIQSRQEMPLVKLMLKRYKRGEDGDYVAEDSYSDLAISNKLPAHYYKDVQCCRNCYKVYGVIDQSRTKALAKIQRKRDKTRGRSLSPDSRNERGLAANANEGASYNLSDNNVIKRERRDTIPNEEKKDESEEDKKNTAINNNTVVYSSWSKRFDNHGEYWRRYISWPWGEVERELVREKPD